MARQQNPRSAGHFCPNCNSSLAFSDKKRVWYCPNWKAGCKFRPVRYLGETVKGAVAKEITPLANPSQEQSILFAWAETSKESGNINARAGTGKTIALVQLVRIFAARNQSVVCLAFARKDRVALDQRTAGLSKNYTSNGAGLGILSSWARCMSKQINCEDNVAYTLLKSRWIQDELIKVKANSTPGESKEDWELSWSVFTTIIGIVEKIRTCLPLMADDPRYPSKPTENDIDEMAARFDYDMSAENRPTIIFYVLWLFAELASLKNALVLGVDFAGQVFLPVYHQLKPRQQYDRVLVDEEQDQNFANRQIALLYKNTYGHIIGVGDIYQAIYGWRGADQDAMGEMGKLMGDHREFALTLCRRCPKIAIAYAQKIVGDIQALPDAPDGTEEHLPTVELLISRLASEKRGLVLCRANAPLFSLCLKLMSMGISCAMAKTNIVSDLLRMIDTLSDHNDKLPIGDLLANLENYVDDKLTKLAKSTGKSNADKAQILRDKAECIRAISLIGENIQTAGDIKKKMDEMFPVGRELDANKMILCSTIHGAKGSEAENVYILSPEGKGVSIFDEIWSGAVDRDNTLYVAVTRCGGGKHPDGDHLPSCNGNLIFVGPMPTFTRFSEMEENIKDIVGKISEVAPMAVAPVSARINAPKKTTRAKAALGRPAIPQLPPAPVESDDLPNEDDAIEYTPVQW